MISFGQPPPGVSCDERCAAYAVIARVDGRIAAVRILLTDGTSRYWLPGSGRQGRESAEDTVVREVREELGRGIQFRAGRTEAIQYFYAHSEGRWYVMRATFLGADFDDSPPQTGEHEVCWVDPREDAALFFHESHVWAASRSGAV